MMIRVWLMLLMAVCLSPVSAAETCVRTGTVCTAPNETRNIDGMSVFRACWAYEDTYECRSRTTDDRCQELRDSGCTQTSSVCVDRNQDGSCGLFEQRFQCENKPATVTERTVCDSKTFCQDGGQGCFDTSSPADADLGRAAAALEASRQAGIYGVDPGKIELFKGFMGECGVKGLGGGNFKNCCKALGGGEAFTNHKNYRVMSSNAGVQIIRNAAGGAIREVGRETLAKGSKYVYDTLYGQFNSEAVDKALDSVHGFLTDKADGTFNPRMSFYGVTFQYSFANGVQFVGFDPYSLAFQLMVRLVQEWLSCEQEESEIGIKRGQELCVHVDSYCGRKVGGVCTVMKQRHCCFNSKLAKIINRGARAQLGLPLDTCEGLNQAQFEAVDFSKIDFDEFIRDIAPVNVPGATFQDRARRALTRQPMAQPSVTNYYEEP